MKLNTNFRSHELARMRRIVISMYIIALVSVSGSGIFFTMYINDADLAAMNRARVKELNIERDAQAAVFKGVGDILDSDKGVRTEWLSLFAKYKGRSPESLLYDLEKLTPSDIYLTNFDYDRYSGVATFTAVAPLDRKISAVLESLERISDYEDVLLVSKSEIGNGKDFKFVVRVAQEHSMDANE